jgi:hypothetical protein
MQITSANGNDSLEAAVEGVLTIDPLTPSFGNFHYDVRFTGGTGRMARVRGKAGIDGFGMFTSPNTGKATWLLQGEFETRRHGR